MFPKKVYYNNFVIKKSYIFVDGVSKFYVYLVWLLGLQRLMLLNTKLPYTLLAFVHTFIINIGVVYIYYVSTFNDKFSKIIALVVFIQYIVCVVIGTVLWKRMHQYYAELVKFDNNVGCRPKITTGAIMVLIQKAFISNFFIFIPVYFGEIMYAPLHFLHITEIHFYAHLFNLLSPRVSLMNFYLESSFSNSNTAKTPSSKEYTFFNKTLRFQLKIDNLMDMYNLLANAHDYLMDAVKWQLTVMLITSFIFVLVVCYEIAVFFINNEVRIEEVLINISITYVEISSMFAMCLCADRVRTEVRRFRELLASTLYNRQLDKCDRSSARALLLLTDSHKLTFTLLRIVDISISLPFSFLGLLITYLIILLQFQKIIGSKELNML